ncbi:hypothetical protein [Paenibacillus albidus]|uniref:hypothetical protein n=1 Tax=Paenibacillus albidus TaxID=2041023 RepID=UPI002034E936|nr:hypothetical protein [Paenibacillus albidus]
MEVLRHGIHPVMMDALIHLNGRHLNPGLPTIYEDVARLGLTSGSINGLIYRGTSNHTLTLPGLLQGTVNLPRTIQVKGPELLTLGSLSNPLEGKVELPDGPLNRMHGSIRKMESLAPLIISGTDQKPDYLRIVDLKPFLLRLLQEKQGELPVVDKKRNRP